MAWTDEALRLLRLPLDNPATPEIPGLPEMIIALGLGFLTCALVTKGVGKALSWPMTDFKRVAFPLLAAILVIIAGTATLNTFVVKPDWSPALRYGIPIAFIALVLLAGLALLLKFTCKSNYLGTVGAFLLGTAAAAGVIALTLAASRMIVAGRGKGTSIRERRDRHDRIMDE